MPEAIGSDHAGLARPVLLCGHQDGRFPRVGIVVLGMHGQHFGPRFSISEELIIYEFG